MFCTRYWIFPVRSRSWLSLDLVNISANTSQCPRTKLYSPAHKYSLNLIWQVLWRFTCSQSSEKQFSRSNTKMIHGSPARSTAQCLLFIGLLVFNHQHSNLRSISGFWFASLSSSRRLIGQFWQPLLSRCLRCLEGDKIFPLNNQEDPKLR